VSSEHFELLGDRVLDLSPRGMLVACDLPVVLGEEVIVSFETPGREPIWLDAEAEIARIVQGFRQGDPGYCVGLRFTYFERLAQGELLARLAGVPPPIPQRRPECGREQHRVAIEPAVVMRPVLRVSPARGACPAGVFYA
jgi:hypothetical protein